MTAQLLRKTLVAMSISAAATATAAPLPPDSFRLEGWRLTVVPLSRTVEIAPPPLAEGAWEGELQAGEPGWRGPQLLPGPAWTYAALRPETLRVTPVDRPDAPLAAGRDFALDPAWAAIAALPGGSSPAGTRVRCTYRYGLSRLDLLERTPAGELNVVQGQPDKSQPHLPAGTPGNTPLAGIYLPNYATALTPELIKPIDPAYDGVPPVERPERLDRVATALAHGRPVTIVCFGDSITAQAAKEMRDGQGSYVDRLAAWLQAAYPSNTLVRTRLAETVAPRPNQTVLVTAGVGGDDTPRALARLDRDVLAHKPDLVVVMFGVNDENRAATGGNTVPVPTYRTNLIEIVTRIRVAGGEPLLMTPSLKNRAWTATVGNIADYAQAMREVAASQDLCLVDAQRAWDLLPRRGYDYMVFLGNCINHPVDLGHDLFFRGLRAAFELAPPPPCTCPDGTTVGRVGPVERRDGAANQDCVTEAGRIHSPVLHRDVEVAVLLPPAYAAEPTRRFPVLYALHGMGAPYRTWLEMAPLRAALAAKPMIVVAFNGDRDGWYIDATQRPRSRFTTFFFDELAPWVDRTYRADPDRRGVTGFSMGANGALHYALTRPAFFRGASGLSSSYAFFGEADSPPLPCLAPLLGPYETNRAAYEALYLRPRVVRTLASGTRLPPLFIGCGTDDRLLTGCRAFRDFLAGNGLKPEYAEAPGGHAWPYWRDASPAVIDFHWRTFEEAPRP